MGGKLTQILETRKTYSLVIELIGKGKASGTIEI